MRRVLRAALQGRARAGRLRLRRLPRARPRPRRVPARQPRHRAADRAAARSRSPPRGRRGPPAGSPYASGYGAGVTLAGLVPAPVRHRPEQTTVVPAWLVRGRAGAARRGAGRRRPPRSSRRPAWPTRWPPCAGRPSVGLGRAGRRRAGGAVRRAPTLPLRLVDRALVVGEQLGQRARRRRRWCRSPRTWRGSSGRCASSRPRRPTDRAARPAARTPSCARSVLLHRLAAARRPLGRRRRRRAARPARSRRPGSSSWHPELAVPLVEAGAVRHHRRAAPPSQGRRATPSGAPTSPTLGALVEAVPRWPTCPTALDAVVRPLGRAHRPAARHARAAASGRAAGADLPLRRRARRRHRRRGAGGLAPWSPGPSVGLRRRAPALDDDAAARDARRGRGAPTAASRCSTTTSLHDPVAAGARRRGARRPRARLGRGPGRTACCWTPGDLDADEAGPPAQPAAVRRHRRAACRRGLARRLPRRRGAAAAPRPTSCSRSSTTGSARVGDEAFEDLLPLLRRTFAHFEPAERRLIGQHVAALARGRAAVAADGERRASSCAGPVRPSRTVARLLGLADAGGLA